MPLKNQPSQFNTLVSTFRKMAEPVRAEAMERCSFCGRPIEPEHRHLVDLSTMNFMCACEMCALVSAENGTYKTLPQRYLKLNEFKMSDALWSEFSIPVSMAFFVFHSARGGTVAYYPAPTGATESRLKMDAWKKLEELNPVLKDMSPDVEGMLVNRLVTPAQYFLVPIDCCYKLIGMIRSTWKGLFGGKEVNDTINNFFIELNQRAHARPEV